MSRSIYSYTRNKLFDLLKKSNVSDNYNEIFSLIVSCPTCVNTSNILNYTPLMVVCDTSQHIYRRLDIIKLFENHIYNNNDNNNDHCVLLAIKNMNNSDCLHILNFLLKNNIGKDNTQLFLRWYQKDGKYKNEIMQLLLKYCSAQILILGFYETESFDKKIAKILLQSPISSRFYSKKLLVTTIKNIVYEDSIKSDFYTWMLSMLLNYGLVTIGDEYIFINKINNITSYINNNFNTDTTNNYINNLGSSGPKGFTSAFGFDGLKGYMNQKLIKPIIQNIDESTYEDLKLNLIKNFSVNDLSNDCKKYINIIPEKYQTNIIKIILQILLAKSYYGLNFIRREIHDLHQQIIYNPNSLRTRLTAIQFYISIGNIDKIITIPNLELLEELGIREFILDDINKCINEALKFAQ
nr:hypothetical protein [Megavirus caiporensis]